MARELHWKAGDGDWEVRIEESGGEGVPQVDDRAIPYIVRGRDARGGWIEIAGRQQRFYLHRDREETVVWIGGRTYRLTQVHKGAPVIDPGSGPASGEIRALMPGKILRIDVAAGDAVQEKQSVVIMESMKMESALLASGAGTVTAIHCQPGQIVEMGALLVTIEPGERRSSTALTEK